MTKKKGFTLIFTIFFLLSMFLPLIPMIPFINSNNTDSIDSINDPLDLFTKNSSKISQGSATGTGNNQTLLLTCEKNEIFSFYNTSIDIPIPTSNWNVSQGYFNFSSINASLFHKIINDNEQNQRYPDDTTTGASFQPACTSFNITADTNLTGISARMAKTSNYFAQELRVLIYNASWVVNHHEPPSTAVAPIYSEDFEVPPSGGTDSNPQWKNFTFTNPIFLNTSETVNNTFFIQFQQLGGTIKWYYQESDNKTTSLYWTGFAWNAITDSSPGGNVDLTLKVNLTNYSPFPSEARMKINGTSIENLDNENYGYGQLTLDKTKIDQGDFSQISFDVTASSDLNFTVNWTCNFENLTTITPEYELSSGGDTEWNATFSGNFLANSFNQEINMSIGQDWENSTVYNNSVVYNDILVDESNDWVFIDNISTNGSWVISSSQEYYGNTIQMYQYGSLNNVTTSKLVNMSDTIYINATLSGATSGEANLTIFDPAGSIIVNKSNNNTITSSLITFTDVILPNVATTNGTYTIQVLWWNGSATSLIQTNLEIINRTQLVLLSDAQITGQHYIGDSINISVYLNDTSKGSGSPCGDADISIEVFNLTDESTVETFSGTSISEGLLGSGFYNYTLDTTNYINGSYKIRVNSTKLGAVNHTLNTSSFSLIFDTNLTLVNFAGTDLGTTYYNNSIFLKFAYDFNNSRYLYDQNVSIGAAFDDATYDNGGTWLPSFNDIITSDPMAGEVTRAYMRFQINLSRSATVTKANLYINITSTTDPDIRIALIEDECSSFPFGSGDETDYPESSNYIDYNASQSIGWNTVDISSLVQAFVNRDNYHPGQYMGLKFKEIFITPDSGDQISISAFETGVAYSSYIDLEANGGEDIVSNPSTVTIQVDAESPETLHLNSTTNTYDIQLNSTEHSFITHTLQVVAQKMGYKNHSKSYSWTTVGANGRIENFLVNQQAVINNTGIVNTNYPNNISISFQYLNDTSIDGAIANVSINGTYEKPINYYSGTETYNFTLNFAEIDYNSTYPETLPKEISVKISKYGYDPLFYNFTWNYDRATTDLTYNGTIASLYTYPTNLTLTLNYSVSSVYPNEEVENARVKVYINDTDYDIPWDPISGLYNVTLNNTNFYNRTETWNITITADRNGFENRIVQFWWNTSEILTSLSLDNIVGTDLGTTYYNNSLYLKYSYNTTSPNTWIQNPDVITIQIDGNTPVTLNTNGSFECYDYSLDSKIYPFGPHTIQVIAQKYGYQNWTRNYTWTTEDAISRIESFLVDGSPVTNITGTVYTNYPNNLTISFVYTNDTAIYGAFANVSIDGTYLKNISYYGATGTYNFTLDFTEINYNSTYPNIIAPVIMINVSKYGYTPAWYNFTWNYSRATTDLTYNGTIASLYTYPTSLTLTLNYSVSSEYSNEEVEDALVTCLVDNNLYTIIAYDSGSGLYNLTLDIDVFPFLNDTAVRNVTINASRNGFENQTIQFWWNVTEILATFTLDTPTIIGTDLGTTYWNNSIFLKFYYNTTAPNQYIQDPDVAKLWLGSNEYDLTYNITSNSYDIMLNTSPSDYGFKIHNIMVNFSKYGYNNFTQNYTWTIDPADTFFNTFDINNQVGLSNNSVISTYYPENISIGLQFFNDTTIDNATVTARVNGGTYPFTYNPLTETYNITLNFTQLSYADDANLIKNINITAWKYGYNIVYYNFSWKFSEAPTSYTLHSPTPIGIDLPNSYYAESINISMNFTRIVPTTGPVSHAQIGLEIRNLGSNALIGHELLIYDAGSGLFNITLNTTDYGIQQLKLLFNASVFGYQDYLVLDRLEYHWNILPNPNTALILYANVSNMVAYNYSYIWGYSVNFTVFYNDTATGTPIDRGQGTTLGGWINDHNNQRIRNLQDSDFYEINAGNYTIHIQNLNSSSGPYNINLTASAPAYGPRTILNIYLYVNGTQTTLISNNTVLNHLTWGGTLTFNLTYNDTTWNQLLIGATLSNNWTIGGVDWVDNNDGNYTVTVPLNDTNLAAIIQAGYWTLRISAALENRTTGIAYINFNITGRTSYSLFNNTNEDNLIIGSDITAIKNITTFYNESAVLIIYFNSTDFNVYLTGASINANWSWGISITPIGGNGTYAIRFFRGASTGVHDVNLNLSLSQYQSVMIEFSIIILPKHQTNITIISAIPASLPAGTVFKIVIRLFDQTANSPLSSGTIIFIIAGEVYIRTVNASGYANVSFTVPSVAFSIEISYQGAFGNNMTAILPLTVQVTTGLDWTFVIIVVVIVMAISIGGTVTAVIIRQRRKQAIERTKARKKQVVSSVTDVANLKDIVVILKETGTDIFHYPIEEGMDPTLFSGFLTAVREFGKELIRTEETQKKRREDELNQEEEKSEENN
ncbi:MAG: hypothetical protein EAX96_06210 [Candidatus Lokiarchaeota archaeon]|nr:hypothetical protein [Candidatus Lokiarchaeota archaeon]